jgi:hypothetical protein
MTERRAKRAKKDAFEKQLLALDKRYDRLQKDADVYIELEKPLLIGYEKYFVLRDDCKSPFLEKLLPLINNVVFSSNKHFTRRANRRTKRANAEKGRKTVAIEPKIRRLNPHQWNQLSIAQQKYFTPKEIKGSFGQFKTVYDWNYPWMLLSKIRKKYITRIKVPNPDVMSQETEIENFIRTNHLQPKITKIRYCSKQNFDKQEDYRYRLLEKQIWREVRQEPPFMVSIDHSI